MKKIIAFGIILISLNNPLKALDIQSKIRNTDKSSYEGISDYKILREGYLQTSISYSVISNPYITKSAKVGGLHEIDFSSIYGFNQFLEFGLSIPYIKTVNDTNSSLKDYSGLSDLYLEGKINIYDYFSVIPVYVHSIDNVKTYSTKNGGFGVKFVSGTELSQRLNLNYGIAQYQLNDNIYGNVDQTVRTQFMIGANYMMNDELVLGSELLYDTMKNRKIASLLNHATIKLDNYKLRAGVSVGIGNNESQSNVGAFLSLVTDFNLFGRKDSKVYEEVKKYEPIKDDEREKMFFDQKTFNDELESVDLIEEDFNIERKNNSQEVNKEKLQEELKNYMQSKKINSSNNDGMEGHSVLPFYTVEEVRSKEKENIQNKVTKDSNDITNVLLKRTELDLKDIEFLEMRENKIKDTLRSLEYFYDMYNKGKITKEKALKEFNWSKKLLKIRRDSVDELVNTFNMKYDKKFDKNELTAYYNQEENELMAMQILKDEKETFKEIVKNEKIEINTQSEHLEKNLFDKEKELERSKRLYQEQSKVMRDGRTVLELKEKTEKELIKHPEINKLNEGSLELKEPSINVEDNNVLIPSNNDSPIKENESNNEIAVLIEDKEGKTILPSFKVELKNKEELVKLTKNKIENLMKEKKEIPIEDEPNYKAFYETYKNKIEEINRKEEERKLIELKKEMLIKEEISRQMEIEDNKVKKEIFLKKKEDMKESGEVQIIELKTFKVKTIEERYEELKKERELINKMRKRNQEEGFSGFNIEEDGDIEISDGPEY